MDELRWILLAAGVLLIAGVYLWGLRSNRRSAPPEGERSLRVEPSVAPSVAPRPQAQARVEPRLGPGDVAAGTPESAATIAFEAVDERALRTGTPQRREPRLEPAAQPATSGPVDAQPARGGEEPPAAPPAQQIIALRVVAPPAGPFDGAALRAAIEAEGFAFGRYQIFHRLDAAGRTVFSLAILKEPGTFDVATMGRASFRGVALFVVLPGPLAGGDAFDALLAAARAIASRLGGLLQDERGVALGPVRIGQLRAAATGFEPSRAPTPDG
jgi:cell division protein ZipA